ncbi:MAG: YicC family protein [Myxococcales bacterium]|nr:YicC family protein [Myxococcales bacterium]
MRSMTGYGRGRCDVAGRRLVVEIRSVNHRFLDLKQRLPWADPGIEQRIALAVRKRIDRGALSLTVRDEGGDEAGPAVTANVGLARAYHRALEEIRVACGLAEPPSLAVIAALPGVLVVGESAVDGDRMWDELAPGLGRAIDELCAAREREGEALRSDLAGRVARLRELAGEVATLAGEAPAEARRRLQDRLARLLAPGEVDPQRLAQEVAILADRADVAEELTRLRTHLDEATRLLAEPRPSGRRLDFLAQELHREVNTVGSKAQRAEIAQRVVEAKTEVERLREQVQNVE